MDVKYNLPKIDDKDVLRKTAQTLTSAEKAQVIENIGAIGEEDTLMTINDTPVKKGDAVTTAETAIVVDGAMSDSSTNAPQNKVVKAYVDAADKALQDQIGNVPADYIDLPYTLSAGYIKANDGTEASSTSNHKTDYIDVSAFKKIKLLGIKVKATTYTTGFAFYDENKQWISSLVGSWVIDTDMAESVVQHEYVVEVPVGAKYFRTTLRDAQVTESDFYMKGQENLTRMVGTKAEKGYVDKGNHLFEVQTFDKTNNGYIAEATGKWTTSSNVCYSIFDISGIDLLKITANTEQTTIIYFLDEAYFAANETPVITAGTERTQIQTGETKHFDLSGQQFKFLYIYLGNIATQIYKPAEVTFGYSLKGKVDEIDRNTKKSFLLNWSVLKGCIISPSTHKITSQTNTAANQYQVMYGKVKKGDIVDFRADLIQSPYNLAAYTYDIRIGFLRKKPQIGDEVEQFIEFDRTGATAKNEKMKFFAPYDGYMTVYLLTAYFVKTYDIYKTTITPYDDIDERIGIVQGSVKNGYADGDEEYACSEIIEGGDYIYIEANEGYRINSLHLYDDSNNMICSRFVGETNKYERRYAYRKTMGLYLPAHIRARFEFVRNSGTDSPLPEGKCDAESRPIKRLLRLNVQNGYAFEQAIDSQVYPYVKYRALTLGGLVQQYKQNTTLYFSGTSYPAINDCSNLPGRKYLGATYCDSREKASVVGQDVSIYTYLSALNNKYSVVYKDIPHNKYSNYGISYTSITATHFSYFEMACNMFWGYCFGYRGLKLSDSTVTDGGYTLKYSANPSSQYHYEGNMTDYIKVLDTMIHTGHVLFILDIITKGSEKFIVTAESTQPYVQILVMSEAEFNDYYMSNSGTESKPNYYTVYRKNEAYPLNAYSQPFDTDNSLYVAHDNTEYPFFGMNEDCVMHIGNRCSIKVGDPVFVNVNRNTDRFTKVNIYKDDTYLSSIDITEMEQWANDPDGEDWVKIDLSLVCTEYGKYRVYASNADETDVSNDALFELIDLTLSKSGNTATFSVSGGIPYVIQEENGLSGFMHGKYVELDEDDTSCDVSTFTKSQDDKIALYAIGDYGCVKTTVSKS